MASVKIKVPSAEPGNEIVQLDLTITAGVNPTLAFTFDRAFAAVPRCIGLVRVDGLATDPGTPSILSLTATGGTVRLNGTSTVNQIYFATFIGNYINPTAY